MYNKFIDRRTEGGVAMWSVEFLGFSLVVDLLGANYTA